MASDLSPYILTASHPVALLILATVAAIVFSIWTYRRTNPPVSVSLRVLLTALRSVALVGGIWLIFQPLLQINRVKANPSNLLVLLDRSASMGLRKNGIDEEKEIANLFNSQQYKLLADRMHVSTYGFSDSLKTILGFPDKFDDPIGPETAIGNALANAMDKVEPMIPAMILLVSDGANNSGMDPVRFARLSKIPISTIGVGSHGTTLDLMITDVSVNPVVYQGSKVPVEVFYRAVGAKDRQFELILRDPNGKSVGKQLVRALDDFSEGKVVFDVPIDSAGRFVYHLEIPELDNELTRDNNYRSVAFNSIANRLRVLVISGVPDYGLGDLIRRLAVNPHIEITQRTERSGGFYEGNWPDDALLAKVDVVIFHHFPTSKTPSSKLQEMNLSLIRSNLPVCLIDGGDLDPANLRLFSELLPVSISTGTGVRTGKISPVRRHAILAPPDDGDFAERWQQLPPLSIRVGMSKLKANSELLAEATLEDGSKTPAVVISETAGRKSAVILVRDLWRWGMLSSGEEGIVEPLLDRLVKWLAIRRSNKPVQLTFTKDQFSTRELISFRAVCFDEGFRPFDGAEVIAEISAGSGDPIKTTLIGEGNGQYKGGFVPWTEANYSVKIEVFAEGKLLGGDKGSITVEAYSIELLEAQLNRGLLQAIADASGGKYVPLDSARAYINSLTFPPESTQIHRNIELWGGWLHLTIVILALSLEWLIRIRLGML